jgi:hypothetical protein
LYLSSKNVLPSKDLLGLVIGAHAELSELGRVTGNTLEEGFTPLLAIFIHVSGRQRS